MGASGASEDSADILRFLIWGVSVADIEVWLKGLERVKRARQLRFKVRSTLSHGLVYGRRAGTPDCGLGFPIRPVRIGFRA